MGFNVGLKRVFHRGINISFYPNSTAHLYFVLHFIKTHRQYISLIYCRVLFLPPEQCKFLYNRKTNTFAEKSMAVAEHP